MRYNKIHHGDCLELMKDIPDDYFDLVITDPPYGIDEKLYRSSYGKNEGGALSKYSKNRWDIKKLTNQHFKEMIRVSKNQIIFGGNYFTNFLFQSRCWICWNKDNPANNFSSIELAWTSFDLLPQYFYYAWGGLSDGILGRNKKQKSLHPTQKPVPLGRWLLEKFANKGDKIFDPFAGSGSFLVACKQLGFDFVGCDIEKEYVDIANRRLSQKVLADFEKPLQVKLI